MLRVLLSCLLATGTAAQIVPAPPNPPSIEPLHSSVPVAYLASVGATAALVGAGLALNAVLPDPPPGSYDDGTHLLYESGMLLVAIGAMAGPSAGNLTLGATDDAGRAFLLKAGGTIVGSVLLVGALGTAFVCFATGPDCGFDGLALGLFYGAIGAQAIGFTAGTVYDLATIPRNAARARERRQSTVAVRPHGAGLALTVDL